MIKCVIFDLDDTLHPEINYCRSGFKAVSRYLADKFSKNPQELFGYIWHKFQQGDREKLFNQLLDHFKIDYDTDFILSLVRLYRDHDPEITLPQDSKAILEQLFKNYTLALLSDGFLPAQKLKAKSLGIENYFAKMVFTEDLGRENWKPSPAGFKLILEDLNFAPNQCVYVADNIKKDFIAPNQLGMHSVQLIRPEKVHTDDQPAPDAQPEFKITRFEQLPELLKKM